MQVYEESVLIRILKAQLRMKQIFHSLHESYLGFWLDSWLSDLMILYSEPANVRTLAGQCWTVKSVQYTDTHTDKQNKPFLILRVNPDIELEWNQEFVLVTHKNNSSQSRHINSMIWTRKCLENIGQLDNVKIRFIKCHPLGFISSYPDVQ